MAGDLVPFHQCLLRLSKPHVPFQFQCEMEVRSAVGVLLLDDNGEIHWRIRPGPRAAAGRSTANRAVDSISDHAAQLGLGDGLEVAVVGGGARQDARHRTKVNDLGITAGLAAQVLQQGKEPRRGLPCHPAPLNGWRGCRNACGQYACHRRCTTASCTAWKQARASESTHCGHNNRSTSRAHLEHN